MKGIERFVTYLDQWKQLSADATKSENIAEYVLNKDGRTIFFMLEGLCKIHKNLHNEKMFSKMGDRFKAVEDLLGEMDHYRECIDEFSNQQETSPRVREYFQSKYENSREQLNELLTGDGWMNGKRIEKISKKLDEADWMKEEKEMKSIRKYYLNEVEEFKVLYKQTGKMTLIEEQLHEFRRRLRWFSIYPHAMQGAIQFFENNDRTELLKKYHTPEVLSSGFNKFPESGSNNFILLLEKNNFLALSWIIDALGKLKDQGLLDENLLHAFKETNTPFEASEIQLSEEKILADADTIMQNFMNDKVLENLVGKVENIRN